MSSQESVIQSLLRETLESSLSPEEACRECPEMLPELLSRLAEVKRVEIDLDAFFPAEHVRADFDAKGALSRADILPRIPGYESEATIGYGGMGVVYRARHLTLNRHVAIKMLLAGGYAGPQELSRFKLEAESVAALCHPNIVQVFDAGECEGHPYFTMELVEGGSLAQTLAGVPQPAKVSAERVATLARAVQFAHAAGIVHRDLKPSNILVAADGTLKIADFGLARRAADDDSRAPLTIPGLRMGTPSFMSPEQAMGTGNAYNPSVDIYALGAILYELLTGRPPFRGEDPTETLRQVIADEPVPPSRLNSKTPRDLETICLKCLQKDPQRRYPTAGDLADDIDRFLSGTPIRARPVSAFERSAKWMRRRPAATALIATLTIAAGAAIATGLWMQRVASTRRTEAAIREHGARDAIESALSLVRDLRGGQRWTEAHNIIDSATTRLGDAASPTLEARLAVVALDLQTAQELDRIRQNYPEPAPGGFDYISPAKAYQALFARIGIGGGVPTEVAARAVRDSAIREQLLVALDNAAFLALVVQLWSDEERYLTIARLADPDPWRDRFRDSKAWRDRESLLGLIRDARSSGLTVPPHQLAIIAVLLSGLGASAETIAILRDALYRYPSDFWINHELANALDHAGQPAEACQFHRAALAVRPDNYNVWNALGTELEAAQGPPEAIVAYRKARDLNPHLFDAWQNLIRCLSLSGRFEEARAELGRASSFFPDKASELGSSRLHWELARRFAARKDWRASADAYAQATQNSYAYDGEAWFEYTAMLLLAGDVEDYRRARERMLEQSNKGLQRPFLTVRAYTLMPGAVGDFSKPAEIAAEELQQSGSQHWSLTQQGAILCRTARAGDAVPLLERSIEADPKPASAILNWLWLAHAQHLLGHPVPARQWFDKAASWLDEQEAAMSTNGWVLPTHIHNWLEAQILRREVAAELGVAAPRGGAAPAP